MVVVRAFLQQMLVAIDQSEGVGVYTVSDNGRVSRALHLTFMDVLWVLTDSPRETDFLSAYPNFRVVDRLS